MHGRTRKAQMLNAHLPKHRPASPLSWLAACLLFALVAAPVADLAHAEHSDGETCYVCTLSSGSAAATVEIFPPTLPKPGHALGSLASTHDSGDTLSDLRSRGPPLIS